MNRIASDEPDEVGILPQPITFWHRGREHLATVSKSATTVARLLRECGGVVYPLKGELGRTWLADPCSVILQGSLQAQAMTRADDARRERALQKRLKGG